MNTEKEPSERLKMLLCFSDRQHAEPHLGLLRSLAVDHDLYADEKSAHFIAYSGIECRDFDLGLDTAPEELAKFHLVYLGLINKETNQYRMATKNQSQRKIPQMKRLASMRYLAVGLLMVSDEQLQNFSRWKEDIREFTPASLHRYGRGIEEETFFLLNTANDTCTETEIVWLGELPEEKQEEEQEEQKSRA